MANAQQTATMVVDGVKLSYADRGEGRPVVFVHGFAASSESWQAVAQTLSESNRVITLDLMGFGRSDKPANQPYTMERQASLLRGFLSQLGLQRFVLAGHSYGGGVCLSLLRRDHGLNLKGLVLVDTVCYPQPLPLGVRVLRLPLLGALAARFAATEFVIRQGLKRAYYRPLLINPRLVQSYAEAARSPGGRHALRETARRLLPPDMDLLLRSYATISIPTLVLWGEKDPLVPVALGRKLSRQIPGAAAQMRVLRDCGHCPQEEMPDRTAEIIGDFLLRLSPHVA